MEGWAAGLLTTVLSSLPPEGHVQCHGALTAKLLVQRSGPPCWLSTVGAPSKRRAAPCASSTQLFSLFYLTLALMELSIL